MKETFLEIFIDFSAYFSLTAGILGIILFLIMIGSLSMLKKLGQFFNNTYSVKKVEAAVNHKVTFNIRDTIFSYSRFSGISLCVISFTIIIFFLFKLDTEKFVVFFSYKKIPVIIFIMLMQGFQYMMIFFLGLVFIYGIILIVMPQRGRRFNDFFDKWYDIDNTIEEQFEKTITKDIDTVSFLRNKHVGYTGLIFSIILTLLALINFFILR